MSGGTEDLHSLFIGIISWPHFLIFQSLLLARLNTKSNLQRTIKRLHTCKENAVSDLHACMRWKCSLQLTQGSPSLGIRSRSGKLKSPRSHPLKFLMSLTAHKKSYVFREGIGTEGQSKSYLFLILMESSFRNILKRTFHYFIQLDHLLSSKEENK